MMICEQFENKSLNRFSMDKAHQIKLISFLGRAVRYI